MWTRSLTNPAGGATDEDGRRVPDEVAAPPSARQDRADEKGSGLMPSRAATEQGDGRRQHARWGRSPEKPERTAVNTRRPGCDAVSAGDPRRPDRQPAERTGLADDAATTTIPASRKMTSRPMAANAGQADEPSMMIITPRGRRGRLVEPPVAISARPDEDDRPRPRTRRLRSEGVLTHLERRAPGSEDQVPVRGIAPTPMVTSSMTRSDHIARASSMNARPSSCGGDPPGRRHAPSRSGPARPRHDAPEVGRRVRGIQRGVEVEISHGTLATSGSHR